MTDTPTLPLRTSMEFDYGVPRELAPDVVRIVANNPGPFTFKGTNTYVIGSASLAVIDAGPDDPKHLAAILAYADGRPITHILITHTHRDHVDGLAALAEATGATVCGYGRAGLRQDPRIGSPTGRAFIDVDFDPDLSLLDGDEITGAGWTLRAIHTPGHAPDHHCYELTGTGVVFSGDHVMGWNTTVVAPPEGHMGDYLASLEKLIPFAAGIYLPGHGGQIQEPVRMTKAYLVHRRMREQAIQDAVSQGHDSIAKIVKLIYQKIDPRVTRAAELSVQAHVEHMMGRGMMTADAGVDGIGPDTRLALAARAP